MIRRIHIEMLRPALHHGRQHHDLNHFRRLLGRTARGRRPVSRPVAQCRDEGRVELARRRVLAAERAAVALYAGTLAAQLARTSVGLSLGDGPPPTAHPRRAAEPLDGSPRPKAVPA